MTGLLSATAGTLALAQSLTPLCPEQAPCLVVPVNDVPSLQVAVMLVATGVSAKAVLINVAVPARESIPARISDWIFMKIPLYVLKYCL
jgi:hypothetical protein